VARNVEVGARRRSRAFTLLELIAVISIIAVLAGILADRLLVYQERAEKAAMERVVVILRSALQLRAAGLLVRGRMDDLKQLESDNPMSWLAERPDNYIGVFANAPPADMATGKWYFDGRNRQLVYVPERNRHFVPGKDGRLAIRFKVRVDVGPLPGEEGRANPMQGVGNLELNATEPVNWFQDADG
jgi:prepilin-type N-terminal cleavage/methylation domain-containing protein